MNKSSSYTKHEKALKKIFGRESEKSAKSYKEKGLLQVSAKEVVNLISQHPDHATNTYLDVGCGTGKICFELVRSGAAKAIGIDITDSVIAEAKQLGIDLKFEDKTEFYAQNFFDFTLDGSKVDGLVCHMVLCCHPDLNSMLSKFIELQPENIFITIPPGGFLAKTIFKPIGLLMKIFTGGFRAYAHSHKHIEAFLYENDYKIVKRFRNGIKSTFQFTKAGL